MHDVSQGVGSPPVASRSDELPSRYEPLRRLGAGGSGEVWSVRDRTTGRVLALKILSRGAGEAEIDALIREAVALSGLEGLGLPRVIAFGALRDRRRYMVRELVDGQSLAEVLEGTSLPWLEPIASACEKLTAVHRAGLLHGDIKPANIIVDAAGGGTLVDLGLATPWREGGTTAQGLTPKYAAPELFDGEPLTVRAEVYAIGATLGEALARRGKELGDGVRQALFKIAARATETPPDARWPSVDEFASALRRAAHLPPAERPAEPPWPVLGLDATARALLDRLEELPPQGALAVTGPRGAGKTTLVRRLAWTLGVAGRSVVVLQPSGEHAPENGDSNTSVRDLADLDLSGQGDPGSSPVAIVDDAEDFDDAAVAALRRASEAGALLVVVGPQGTAERMAAGPCREFAVPALEPQAAEELVQRAVPSLPDALREQLAERVGGRPGALRAAVRRLAGRAIVSAEDVEAALSEPASGSMVPSSSGRSQALAAIERTLDMGRFDEAARELEGLGDGSAEGSAKRGPLASARRSPEGVRVGLMRARIAVGRGETQRATEELAAIEAEALASGPSARAWVGSSRVDLQACKLEYSIVSPK